MKPDWKLRDANVAYLESRLGKIPGDMLIPRMLSSEYLQRYRERGDLGDVLRAERTARMSLAAQPRGNVAGDVALSDALLTLHRFREARAALADARRWKPFDQGLAAGEASLDLELGDVAGARALVDRAGGDAAFDAVTARLDEETGHLADARALVGRAMRRADAIYDTPAERRAWYHARSSELALEANDVDAARRDARDALTIFPNHLRALTDLARADLAANDAAGARDAAQHAVDVQPNPEVLGLLGDAQTALGDAAAAARTGDAIAAVERIGAAQRVNDRLVALWEADHDVRTGDAYTIARREVAVRDDVYAEDTLAWAAAKSGHWDVARAASARAMQYGIEDPRVRAHAAYIASHAPAR